MAAQPVILQTKPAGPVDFSESAIKKVFETTGYVIADTKEDGVQLNLVVDNDMTDPYRLEYMVNFLSREGKFLPGLQAAYMENMAEEELSIIDGFSELLRDDACIYPNGFMLQGEIICPGESAEVTAGNLRRTKLKKGDTKPLLALDDIEVHVFGVVPLDVIASGEDHDVTHALMKYHVEAMMHLLKKHVPQIKWVTCESLDVFSMEELTGLFEKRREQGKEGLVLKDPNAIWKRGKRAGQWKMKPDDSIDGKVVGLVWGTKGLANEGKVIGFEVELEDGMVVNACNITQEQRKEFTEAVTEWEQLDRRTGGLHVTPKPYIDWAVEVSFMERFKDGSLRHPSFSRWRGISDPMTKE